MSDERLKIWLAYGFGWAVLFVYFSLAASIALGHVQKDSSYGLDIVLSALGPLGGMFCGWAFGQRSEK